MRVPDKFLASHAPQLKAYIERKYSTYGFPKERHITFNPEWIPTHSRERYRWVENVSKGLRVAGNAESIIRLDHTGWFVDNFQSETTNGVVYQLPSRGGKKQYVPGNSDPCNPDCAVLDFHSITDSKEDAARWADQMAESYAENEREYQAKDQAGQRLAEIEEEIEDVRKDLRAVMREVREAGGVRTAKIVHKLVRAYWLAKRGELAKLRAEKERIAEYGIDYAY